MTILVVDDDKKIANFIKRGLETEGYKVEVAHDGKEGLELALERSYGLIILDVMLTKKDGLTLLRELRVKKNFTPVLIVSGKTEVEDIVAGLDAEADDYMTKPFALVELLARVRAFKRRSQKDRGSKIFFSDLCLDPVTHQVWQNEKEIELSAKEYELLEFFIRNPNQVLTRNMIADEVWGGMFDKFTNIIDVYVNFLRKKIHHDDTRTLIHTVRGVGYLLKEVA
jgi:DNA-binding response OmpR family regulator